MNKLEDYLLPENLREKKKSLEDSIVEHLDRGTFAFRENLLHDELIAQLEKSKKLQEKLQNIANSVPENSHRVDAVIDDGGISGRELTEEEWDGLELEYLDEWSGIDEINDGHDNIMSDIAFKLGKVSAENLDNEIMEMTQGSIVSDIIEQSSKILDTEKGDMIDFPDYLLNDPEIVGYPDEEMQNEIYEWVESKLPTFDRPISVKDLGSGRGDFYGYISQCEIEIRYIGIDSNPNLVAVGRQKYKDITLIYDDFLKAAHQTDYTICIGTLNDDHGFDKWEYFNRTLNHILNTTNKSVIFVLSANNDGLDGFLDYPIYEMARNLGTDLLFEIDYSKFKDIYLLTVHVGGYDETE